ncbi:Formate--tetrahydrofolate ligase [Caldicellulosiruptor saccharolyticus DSM 8903]|uniref:Formate--tetrahydrofolate ligase n=2 Tax=Caldicellulosiruptor saccharolyticus TaxID=44001 RepID=FTHS_CALS8|nr:formate--tetrahydrofolate ligase [Caldicellulosiruptor saccharolyticus]A4XIU2.1 RecName: Full=Formate--tetrahydrofolate ligase; AltName: Full=Formyltetrahydrofolate synthetase; Short=FHS; Short=FTHFS [Caldicellulosiruptor saccharolyticus DSM 8903]ABP66827.1 Formate--tetrahydrofolate ligase [Caldicellulosiruptor saccharolyticus DSM 8903]
MKSTSKLQEMKLKNITEIAESVGLSEDDIELYGKYKAKISLDVLKQKPRQREGKVILVTSINPTPYGEGKTTTAIGLSMAINRLGFKSIVTLREPSLGPYLGIKGGATGGGVAQVLPSTDINLHFTGDIHAVTSANNLLCAAIDNHIYHGNELNINPKAVMVKRAMDMNDRALRNIVIGLGDGQRGAVREDGFIISVASEVMAILCLSNDLEDLKERLGNILVGFSYDKKPIYAKDLKVHGAMALLLKDAIKPNLVQTSEATAAIIHGGPFANIAHGTNSIIAIKIAQKLSDYVVVEAGFGADLGAEKFVNIVSRKSGIYPSAAVMVVTTKALKYHGSMGAKENLTSENIDTLKKGFKNLEKHIENLKLLGLEAIVTLNRFPHDTPAEISEIESFCKERGVEFAVSEAYELGSEGALDLAQKVIEVASRKRKINFVYEDSDPVEEKIRKVAKTIYGAADVQFSKSALLGLELIKKLNIDHFPICMAKTQYSLSDDPKLLGRPKDFVLNVNEIRINNGAQFIVVICGDIMTMPGLSKDYAALHLDIDEDGNVVWV